MKMGLGVRFLWWLSFFTTSDLVILFLLGFCKALGRVLWKGLSRNMSLWFRNLIIPDTFFKEVVAPYVSVFPFLYKHEAKLVRKVLSGTSVSTSDGSTGYSWKKNSKSFFYFLNSLSLKYFSASSGPYATEGLWSVAAWTWTGGRSSLKSAQNEKLEGGAMPWKDPYLSKLGFHFWGIFFFLTLPNSSSSVKSQSPAPWIGWMCTSGAVTRSWMVPEAEHLLPVAQGDIWVVKSPRAQSSHLTQKPNLVTQATFFFPIKVHFVCSCRLFSCFILSCLFFLLPQILIHWVISLRVSTVPKERLT